MKEESSRTTAYMRTLRSAAETLGGEDRLAELLRVRVDDLARWMSGEEYPPEEIFLVALDVVADGPLIDLLADKYLAKGREIP